MKSVAIVIIFIVLVFLGEKTFGWIGVVGAVGITGAVALAMFREASASGGFGGGIGDESE